MNKYFEKNHLADEMFDIEDVDDFLWSAFRVLAHNIEVRVAMPSLKRRCIEGREGEIEENAAATALVMIGACEALLSKLDPEAVETAGEEIEKKLAKGPQADFSDLLRAFFGLE